MSTHWYIGMVKHIRGDLYECEYTYVNFDGQPERVLPLLRKYIKTPKDFLHYMKLDNETGQWLGIKWIEERYVVGDIADLCISHFDDCGSTKRRVIADNLNEVAKTIKEDGFFVYLFDKEEEEWINV